ncbi:RNA binding domain protein [Paecilomyces variotii No. 5]|uniref:RNA binding domain protein n=1 Tax=Byssochlamys spectabilis (strain No. 5 / NBRC 109023) TaxID=1356009 RepID=V5F8D0_BYSSN|nr:RNA binding domain protein [Paecilomyces variotii No. 5]
MFETQPPPLYSGMTVFEGPPPPIYPFVESGVIYPRRVDRAYARPCATNAQGLFPPSACLFIGNLSTQVSRHQLARDLEARFAVFGNCHVKIKYDKKNQLPTAFLQFERMQDAEAALQYDNAPVLHGRVLRIERAKSRRTASLGRRNSFPMTEADVYEALYDRGPLEAFCIQPVLFHGYYPTQVATVTFAYIDDCIDAIKVLEHSFKYFMQLLPIDGSPLLAWAPPTLFLPPCPPFPHPPLPHPMLPHAFHAGSNATHEYKSESGSRNTVTPSPAKDEAVAHAEMENVLAVQSGAETTNTDTESQSTVKNGRGAVQQSERTTGEEGPALHEEKPATAHEDPEQDSGPSSIASPQSRSRSGSRTTETTLVDGDGASNKTSPSPVRNAEYTGQDNTQSTLSEEFKQSLHIGSTIIPKIRPWVYQEMLERNIELSAKDVEEVIRDLEEEQRVKEFQRAEKKIAKPKKKKT